MAEEILFEIKKDNLETGLRGYPVGYCTTSLVEAQKGLVYVNIPVEKLAYKDPEDVIYLLYHGKEGSPEELTQFKKVLREKSSCSAELLESIQKLPKKGHPNKLFCNAILIAGMLEGKNDYEEDCLNLIAKIPVLAAQVINYHAGWGGINPSKPELGYMENFAQMLNVPQADLKKLNEAFRIFNILHLDHGGGNLSTFVGKAVASGLEDMYGSMCSAMCALAGPRHGKANQECLEFVEKILHDLGENASEAQLEEYLRKLIQNNELIFGFGHAVLRIEDPRAAVLYEFVEKHYPNFPLSKITALLRKVGPKVLKENPKISDPYPNVDAISGSFLSAAGFHYPEYYTILFGVARIVGIAIQVVYERVQARGGKGTPIVRPKYYFKNRLEVSDKNGST